MSRIRTHVIGVLISVAASSAAFGGQSESARLQVSHDETAAALQQWLRDVPTVDIRCHGASLGGLLGGMVGGVVGAQLSEERRSAGAVTGSAAGALLGTLLGARMDAQDPSCVTAPVRSIELPTPDAIPVTL